VLFASNSVNKPENYFELLCSSQCSILELLMDCYGQLGRDVHPVVVVTVKDGWLRGTLVGGKVYGTFHVVWTMDVGVCK
jgi:hypothetical protein